MPSNTLTLARLLELLLLFLMFSTFDWQARLLWTERNMGFKPGTPNLIYDRVSVRPLMLFVPQLRYEPTPPSKPNFLRNWRY